MRYDKIDPGLFINNRKNLIKYLKPNSLVVLHADDVMPKNADGIMPFIKNSDFFYLSGVELPTSVLILYPDTPNKQQREILFIKKISEKEKIWDGIQYDKDTLRSISGIQQIYWMDTFQQILHILMEQVSYVYLNSNEQAMTSVGIHTKEIRFTHWCQSQYPLHAYERLAPIMQQLRIVKSEIEIALIKTACNITEQGIREVLALIKPGIMEYEIEAALSCAFIKRRANGFAFKPIIASGANACILHYNTNHQICKQGDLVLLDIGAVYAHYNADVTRVIPISGRFTKRQRIVYDAVLRVMQCAKQLLIPGTTLAVYQKEIVKIIEKELLDLGLLDRTDIKKQDTDHPAYKKYFMHNTSHHLGLDVHDLGDIHTKLQPNMVLTVEPGIYIREEGLGIRIENDVVIKATGDVEDLTVSIPLDPDEIESLMHDIR